MSVPNKHDAPMHFPKKPPTEFVNATRTVRFVESNDGKRIDKGPLSLGKRYSVFSKIRRFLS